MKAFVNKLWPSKPKRALRNEHIQSVNTKRVKIDDVEEQCESKTYAQVVINNHVSQQTYKYPLRSSTKPPINSPLGSSKSNVPSEAETSDNERGWTNMDCVAYAAPEREKPVEDVNSQAIEFGMESDIKDISDLITQDEPETDQVQLSDSRTDEQDVSGHVAKSPTASKKVQRKRKFTKKKKSNTETESSDQEDVPTIIQPVTIPEDLSNEAVNQLTDEDDSENETPKRRLPRIPQSLRKGCISLAVTHPQLAAEWDPANGSMANYSKGSHNVVGWICPGKEHHKYRASIYNHVKATGTGCRECYHDSIRLYDKKEQTALHNSQRVFKNTTAVGDGGENYLADELRALNYYPQVSVIGRRNDKTDVIVTLPLPPVKKKSVQVKTLYPFKDFIDYYQGNIGTVYSDTMLMVFMDVLRTRFALAFYQGIKQLKTAINCNFQTPNPDYENVIFMFTDKSLFMAKFKEMITDSVDYSPTMGSSYVKEAAMFQRVEQECIKRGCNYYEPTSNGNAHDITINSVPIQAKYHSKNQTGTFVYQIQMYKNGGYLNGKTTRQPYCFDDPFKYAMIEIGGTTEEPTKYHGQFCNIPMKVLIKQGIVSTKDKNGELIGGMTGMYICPPDYKRKHWSKKFWNDWTPFQQASSTHLTAVAVSN